MRTSRASSAPPLTVGELLSAWRTRVAYLSQDEVSGWFGVSGEAISQWESGARLRRDDVLARDDNVNRLEKLDENFHAGGVFAAMARSIGSPDGLPPRRRWSHNFPMGWHPIWVWLRPQPETNFVSAECRWGPLRLIVREQSGPSGVIVTAPVSVSNPPLFVLLDQPGWVDFGTGNIPPELGFRLLSASRQFIARLVPESRDRINELLSLTKASNPEEPLPPDEPTEFSGEDLRRLRISRLLTQHEVAELVAKLGTNESVNSDAVNESQIMRIESGGGVRPSGVHSRLDIVYGADGYICCEDYHNASVVRNAADNSTTFTVEFPHYWIGPIWLITAGPHEAARCEVKLQWGPWLRTVDVPSGAVLTTRRARADGIPLQVTLPTGWNLKPGMGVYRGAIDINNGWLLGQNVRLRLQVVREVKGAYLRLVGDKPTELIRLIDTIRRRTVQHLWNRQAEGKA